MALGGASVKLSDKTVMSTGKHEISTVSVLVRPIKLDFRPIAAL